MRLLQFESSRYDSIKEINMNAKSLFSTIIVIFTWMFSISFIYIHSKGSLNVSPWTMHNFKNISLQILLIILPLIGLFFCFFINKKVLKYLFIFGSLINIYYLTFPYVLIWLTYFKLNK